MLVCKLVGRVEKREEGIFMYGYLLCRSEHHLNFYQTNLNLMQTLQVRRALLLRPKRGATRRINPSMQPPSPSPSPLHFTAGVVAASANGLDSILPQGPGDASREPRSPTAFFRAYTPVPSATPPPFSGHGAGAGHAYSEPGQAGAGAGGGPWTLLQELRSHFFQLHAHLSPLLHRLEAELVPHAVEYAFGLQVGGVLGASVFVYVCVCVCVCV
jgi:hypothetical protein